MQLIQKRLKRVDIYSAGQSDSGYIGKKPEPTLLGFVYADVQPIEEKMKDELGGTAQYSKARLLMRPDAGVKCGDYAAVFGNTPDCRITEIKRGSSGLSAIAERI